MVDEGTERTIGTFVSIVTVLIILGIYGCVQEGDSAAAEQLYEGVPIDAHLLAHDKAALDDAYEEHVRLLFSVWLKDDVKVVHRINTGLRNARHAYSIAAAKIEEREKAQGGAK